MTRSKITWRVVALSVAVAFFGLALRVDVYNATSPPALARTLFGPDTWQFAHPWWLSLHIWVRKVYSVVAFALVGYTAHRALAQTARPVLRATLMVAAYSFGIEIAQRLFVATEPVLESALDVACGALGGWLAIQADNVLGNPADRRRRAQAVPQRIGQS
jgi:hypothetical protein